MGQDPIKSQISKPQGYHSVLRSKNLPNRTLVSSRNEGTCKKKFIYTWGTGYSCTGSSPSVNDILFQGYMKLFLCSEGKRRNKGTILATRYAFPPDSTEPFLFQDSRNSFHLEVIWANGLCTGLLGVSLSLLRISRPICSWPALCILSFPICKMGITILASPPHDDFCD